MNWNHAWWLSFMQYLTIAEENWMVVKYFAAFIWLSLLIVCIWRKCQRLADTLR